MAGTRYIGQSMKTKCCACIGYLLLAVCNYCSINTLQSPLLDGKSRDHQQAHTVYLQKGTRIATATA